MSVTHNSFIPSVKNHTNLLIQHFPPSLICLFSGRESFQLSRTEPPVSSGGFSPPAATFLPLPVSEAAHHSHSAGM